MQTMRCRPIARALLIAIFGTLPGAPCVSDVALADDNNGQIAVSLARFGVSIFATTASLYDESVRKDPVFYSSDPQAVKSDVEALAKKYKTQIREAQTTADLTQSLGDVIITSSVTLAT